MRIAAVIGHADEAGMLRRCISHHLALGCAGIFVSLNRGDAESAEVVGECARAGPVESAPVGEFARSEFDFLTDAVREAERRFRPERVLVIDSDEFCVAETGALEDAPDLLTIPRYNAALRNDDTLSEVNEATLVISPGETSDSQLPRGWLTGPVAPKILVRPDAVEKVWRGGHGVDSAGDQLTRTPAANLAIVHFPFTTLERFKDKLAGIRGRIESFQPNEAGHWRTWLRLADAGGREELFAAQFFSANEFAEGRREGRIRLLGELLQSGS